VSLPTAAVLHVRQFVAQCDLLLRATGFDLGPGPFVVPGTGVPVDREATSPSGRTIWFAYKGSLRGVRPGLRRTDAVKQAIAHGALLRDAEPRCPYVVLTSHVPGSGLGPAMLAVARRLGYVDHVICVFDPEGQARLRAL
jgi:hypothetical protein